MSAQLDLFAEEESRYNANILDQQNIDSWESCWNWKGPKVGGMISFNDCIANDINGNACYVMMQPARVLEITGNTYRVEFLGCPTEWHGRQFLLTPKSIWPCLGKKGWGNFVVDTYEEWKAL